MISCEHPNIIFSPNIVYQFSRCKRANLNGHIIDCSRVDSLFTRFPWKDFYAAKNAVTIDTIGDYVLFTEDGETFPAFMVVPCGHCRLCRANKVRDMQTRCAAESASHAYKPIFITLTYNDDNLPSDMSDCLADFQRFLKRLRIKVQRKYGDFPLRYMAVSEYTPTTHRPHIHMLLWGLPYITHKSDESSFFALNNFISDTWSNGFVKSEICRDSSGAYCLKYMKKGTDPDCWLVSSRRNGIGYNYAMSLLPFVLKNPDITKFTIRQRDGSFKTYVIPAYFRRIWFPTVSKFIPSTISNYLKTFFDFGNKLGYALTQFYGDHPLSREIADMFSIVQRKYDMFPIDWRCVLPDATFQRIIDRYSKYRQSEGRFKRVDDRYFGLSSTPFVVNGLICPKSVSIVDCSDRVSFQLVSGLLDGADMISFRRDLISMLRPFRDAFQRVMAFDFDRDEVLSRLAITAAHSEYIRGLQLTRDDDLTLQDKLDTLQVDLDWIETHWISPATC